MNFGQWLNKKLYQMDRSQEWLYRRANISTGSVQRWTRGTDPSTETFLRICRILAAETNSKQTQVIEDYILEKK